MTAALEQAFRCNAETGADDGASVSVWQNGVEALTLCHGEARPGIAWTPQTLVPVYSATKAPAAAALLTALYDCCRSPELEIGDVWPEFPVPHGTVAQLLSHQLGLAALREPASVFSTDDCRRAIERSCPAWLPPQHGYHPHTYGPLVDILMQKLTGMRIGEFWEERIRRPLGLDLYIGLPESEFARVAFLQSPRMQHRMPQSDFYSAYFDPESAVYRAFHNVTGLESARRMNTPEAWQCGCPAKGGVASAAGLARFYQLLMGNGDDSPFPPEVTEWMTTPQCCGFDLTLMCRTGFACGTMFEPAELFGNSGFGHAGAGGCHAFCEPESGLSFAYVMNRMELGILPGERVKRLLRALKA